MIKLGDGDLRGLLPQSIAVDAGISAAAAAVEPCLRTLALALPNLLIYARLGGQDPEQMLPPLRRLIAARGGLRAAETALLESLAWQFHVDFREAAQTPAQLADMVRNAIPWHRIKGTPAGVRAALALFGVVNVDIEEGGIGRHWASYQLGVGDIPDLEAVARIARVAFAMQPARCQLWRIHNAYDLRPGVAGGGEGEALSRWGDALWGDYSGVLTPGIPGTDTEDFWLSLGRRLAVATPCWGPSYIFCQTTGHAFLSRRSSVPRWGTSAWADMFTPNLPFMLGVLLSAFFGTVFDDAGGRHLGRVHPAWDVVPRGISRCQGVGGDSNHAWGDSNTRFGVTVRTIPAEDAVWAQSLWSGTAPARLAVVHELFARLLARPHAVRALRALPSITSTALWTQRMRQPHRVRWTDAAWGELQTPLRSFHGAALWSGAFAETLWRNRSWSDGASVAADRAADVWGGSRYSQPDGIIREAWGPWPWLEPAGVGRALPVWSLAVRGIHRLQGVGGDSDHTWGDSNTRFGAPTPEFSAASGVFGEDAWSDAVTRMYVPDVYVARSTTLGGAQGVEGFPLPSWGTGRRVMAARAALARPWAGPWSDVSWGTLVPSTFSFAQEG